MFLQKVLGFPSIFGSHVLNVAEDASRNFFCELRLLFFTYQRTIYDNVHAAFLPYIEAGESDVIQLLAASLLIEMLRLRINDGETDG